MSAGCNYAGLIVVLPTTDGDRIVIVDYYISGVVPKSLSSLDAKRALYPVNDIKVFYKYIAKNVTNFWRCPQKAVPLYLKSFFGLVGLCIHAVYYLLSRSFTGKLFRLSWK